MFSEKDLVKEVANNQFSNGKRIICICLVLLLTYVAVHYSKEYLKNKQNEQAEKINKLLVNKTRPTNNKKEKLQVEDPKENKKEVRKEIESDSDQEFRVYRISVDVKFAIDTPVSKAIVDLKKLSGIVGTSPSVDSMTIIKAEAQDESGGHFDISLEK